LKTKLYNVSVPTVKRLFICSVGLGVRKVHMGHFVYFSWILRSFYGLSSRRDAGW